MSSHFGYTKMMLYLILNIIFLISVAEAYVNVTLPNGKIRGHKLYNVNDTPFYAFQEIPYARPPIENLRFEPPVAPNNWEGMRDGRQNTKICYQQTSNDDRENEDCLYLNVYTPVAPHGGFSIPVLVFIHGGAFTQDTATYESYGPDFLMDYNIVVVNKNIENENTEVSKLYSDLSWKGFLSTDDNTLPGNYGLKDQLFALKWVQSNIQLFGGDPNKVTIYGQSAGSASAAYQLISRKDAGLFRAAILTSGTAINSWAYQRHATKIAYQVAQQVDPSFSEDRSSKELKDLLKSVSGHDLDRASAKIQGLSGIRLGKGDVFGPNIELSHTDAFITENMHTRLEEGEFNQVPILIGINSEERISLASRLTSLKKQMAEFDNQISEIVNADYNVGGDEIRTEVGKKIRSIYTDGLFQDDLAASIRFHSDVRYTTAVIRHAALQSRFTNVYFYQFSYDGKLGGGNTPPLEGTGKVGHSENNNYIFKKSGFNDDLYSFPNQDVLTSKRLLTLITNFVVHLNPTPEPNELLQNVIWRKFNEETFEYLDIDEDLTLKSKPKEYLKWKEIIDSYGHPPFDTY